jgi:hypothetical protein
LGRFWKLSNTNTAGACRRAKSWSKKLRVKTGKP